MESRLSPSPSIIAASRLLNENPELATSPEGLYWTLHAGARLEYIDKNNFSLAKKLCGIWPESQIPNGITVTQIQDAVKEQAEALLRMGDPTFRHWNKMLSIFRNVYYLRNPESVATWRNHGRPVIQHLIDRVNELRTPAWQRDPYRSPAYLPDMFEQQLWMLDHPRFPPVENDDAQQRAKCDLFAVQVRELLDRIVQGGSLYHQKYARISSARGVVMILFQSDRLNIACSLGNVDFNQETLSTSDSLAVELVENLFMTTEQHVSDMAPRLVEDIERTRSLLVQWAGSKHEELRMAAFRVQVKMKENPQQFGLTQADLQKKDFFGTIR